MRIFRYLFKEVFSSFAAVSFIILLIFISSRFIKYLARAANGGLSSDILLWIILYRLPGFLEIILPIGFFIGVMLACGRLYVDSEMVVLQACGISKNQLLKNILGPATLLAIVLFALTCWVTPLGAQKYYQIWNDPENFDGASTLVEGSFKTIAGKTVIYTGGLSRDKSELRDVFVLRDYSDRSKGFSVMRADAAKIIQESADERYIELKNGVEYSGALGTKKFTISAFEKYTQWFEMDDAKELKPSNEIDGKSTADLWHSQHFKERAHLQWRLSMPLIMFVLAILALALSETSHRKGRYAKMLPGLVLYMLYFGALVAARSAMEKGQLPESTLWGIHGFFLVLALYLLNAHAVKQLFKRQRGAA